MTTINTAELEIIADLSFQDFKAAHLTGNNVAVSYYNRLAVEGATVGNSRIQEYGELAGTVASNDGVTGGFANGYSQAVADDHSVDLTVGSDAWLRMQYELMQADLTARRDHIQSGGSGEISYQKISEAHTTAMNAVGLPPGAYSLYIPLSQLGAVDPQAAQELFNRIIGGEGPVDLLQDGLLLAFGGKFNSDQTFAEALATYGDQAIWLSYLADSLSDFIENYGGDPEDIQGLVDGLDTIEALLEFIGASLHELSPWADKIPSLLNPYGELPTEIGAFLPQAVLDALGPWCLAPTTGSPLVLDLDGDGIELTTFNAQSTLSFFDIDGDGFAEQTAWVGADDGLLVRDLDQSGSIDSVTELFGSPTIDGFALLASLDGNGDHVINQFDDVWTDLLVWRDANGDAATQLGELHSLSSLGIASLDLAGVVASTSAISGNPISHTSTYRLENGSTRNIVDAWFVYDNVNTQYADKYTLDIHALFLPSLRGYGKLTDLHIAISQSANLLELVQGFASTWSDGWFADGPSLNADVAEILWAWAGVSNVDPNSRGGYIDARKLEFMEQLFGNDFIQNGAGSNPLINASVVLEEAWERVYHAMKAQLLVQLGASSVFGDSIWYNVLSGEYEGDMILSQSAVDDLEASAPTIEPERRDYWEQVAEFIAFTKGLSELTLAEQTMLDDAIAGSGASYDWDAVQQTAVPEWVGVGLSGSPDDDTISGTGGADSLDGGAGDDTLYGLEGNDTLVGGIGHDSIYGGDHDDTLYGGDGNDTLYGDDGGDLVYGNEGNDVIYGGAGDDILHAGAGGDVVYGGSGSDVYVFSGGNDYYVESVVGQIDTIQMPSGVELGDLDFHRANVDEYGNADLVIDVLGSGTIQIENFFYAHYLKGDSIEELEFYDLSTFDLSSLTTLITYGGDGNDYISGIDGAAPWSDTIFGFGGNDTLSGRGGDDVLDGGVGNDTLYGGAGNDLYIFSPGFDLIVEDQGGTDTIRLPEGFDTGDLRMLRSAATPNDLILMVDGLGQLRVEWQFYGFSSTIVEYIDFNGSNAIDLTQASIETFGTSGNDNINGIGSGASINDILDGGFGDDTLQGLAGDDIYYFSAGQDVVYESDGTDGIKFRDGVNPEDITVYRDAGKNLIVEDGDGNALKVSGHFNSTYYSVEYLQFYDTTLWDLSVVEIITRGTEGADTIHEVTFGDASTDDEIYGLGGNDTIYGGAGNDWIDGGEGDDYIVGGDGDDTYVYTSGLDTVVEAFGDDVLHISGGLTINDIAVADWSTWHVKVSIDPGVDEVTLNFFRQNTSYRTETVRFDDGFETSLLTYSGWLNGTTGNDMVAGNANDNTLIGFAGNDSMTGGAGNDAMHGGAGNDTVEGEDGDDLLYGGDGDDTLYGGAGLDTMHGGAGADTFVFELASAFSNVDVIRDFSVGDDDVIDLTDILDTVYDPLTDAIADFVQFTESSGNTFVEVDRDGTGSTYSFAQIAKLEGVTNLASPELLETNGNLLAA